MSEIINTVIIGKDGWLFSIFDARREVKPALGQQVVELVGKAVALLKAAGIETTIALLPARSRIYKEFVPADIPLSPLAEPRYAQLAASLGATGALVPDLAAMLSQARQRSPGTLLYLKGDSHWTGEAAFLTAGEIGRQIQARYRLPPSARPGVQLGAPVETDQAYDLARMLPPERPRQYPEDSYEVRRPVRAAGLLADEAPGDVAVVGNSYMQPRYGFADALSAELKRPVSLVWQVNLFGPYSTLVRYLGSIDFRRQRPKVLVWTFQEVDMDVLADRREVWGQNAMANEAFLAEVKRLLG